MLPVVRSKIYLLRKNNFLLANTTQEIAQDSGPHPFGWPLGLVLLVLYKGIWGLLEVCAGLLVVFSHRIFSGELTDIIFGGYRPALTR